MSARAGGQTFVPWKLISPADPAEAFRLKTVSTSFASHQPYGVRIYPETEAKETAENMKESAGGSVCEQIALEAECATVKTLATSEEPVLSVTGTLPRRLLSEFQ